MSYAGCLENVHGFYPLRNPDSKWYISYEEMPDEVVRSRILPIWMGAPCQKTMLPNFVIFCPGSLLESADAIP